MTAISMLLEFEDDLLENNIRFSSHGTVYFEHEYYTHLPFDVSPALKKFDGPPWMRPPAEFAKDEFVITFKEIPLVVLQWMLEITSIPVMRLTIIDATTKERLQSFRPDIENIMTSTDGTARIHFKFTESDLT